CQKYLSSPFTF
nr:immunoglobulin light chain junction region [Macaca mulatta]MOV63528.1 immunoglobulin light chain junction region [Macaca mulatta]